MKVNVISEQGFCFGVNRSLRIVKEALNNPDTPKPIYILGVIIHNKFVNKAFEENGIILLSENNLERIKFLSKRNIGTVILTAHGVSPKIYDLLNLNNYYYIDATCPAVKYVQDSIIKYLSLDYEVIYIGNKGHVEVEAVLDISKLVHLVESLEDIKSLEISNQKIYIQNQTTLSLFDLKPIVDALVLKFPNAIREKGICQATTKRQMALQKEIKGQLCLVVGDKNSSNSNKLKKIGQQFMQTYLIESIEGIQLKWLDNVDEITVTSGASTPKAITNEVINFLKKYNKKDFKDWNLKSYVTSKDII